MHTIYKTIRTVRQKVNAESLKHLTIVEPESGVSCRIQEPLYITTRFYSIPGYSGTPGFCNTFGFYRTPGSIESQDFAATMDFAETPSSTAIRIILLCYRTIWIYSTPNSTVPQILKHPRFQRIHLDSRGFTWILKNSPRLYSTLDSTLPRFYSSHIILHTWFQLQCQIIRHPFILMHPRFYSTRGSWPGTETALNNALNMVLLQSVFDWCEAGAYFYQKYGYRLIHHTNSNHWHNGKNWSPEPQYVWQAWFFHHRWDWGGLFT